MLNQKFDWMTCVISWKRSLRPSARPAEYSRSLSQVVGLDKKFSSGSCQFGGGSAVCICSSMLEVKTGLQKIKKSIEDVLCALQCSILLLKVLKIPQSSEEA